MSKISRGSAVCQILSTLHIKPNFPPARGIKDYTFGENGLQVLTGERSTNAMDILETSC